MAKEPAISIRDLRKSFGDVQAVDGINLDIPAKGVFGLLGPNGAGKSTTINLICGLHKPSSGSIAIKGQSIANMKSQIGYCTQENNYYPKLTCFEQLVFIGIIQGIGRSKSIKRAKELIEMLGLEAKSSTLAHKLSGGMKRRLTLALALVHEPAILVLDEPEAGLDPQSRILVREFISDYAENNCVLLSTHNMDEADRLAQVIAIIDMGKVLACDVPSQLKRAIGEGDILELDLLSDAQSTPLYDELLKELHDRLASPRIQAIESTLWLQARKILNDIPTIIECCRKLNITITEIRLRENTLEDVFIHLTGKKLRQ